MQTKLSFRYAARKANAGAVTNIACVVAAGNGGFSDGAIFDQVLPSMACTHIACVPYASHSDLQVHIGLGLATKVEKLEILWSNGDAETIVIRNIDRAITIQQGVRIVGR